MSSHLKEQGFTVVELMIALVVAAILLTIGVPVYWGIIQNNRVAALTNNLSASLNLARMEAIKRGVSVVVCPASNQNFTACANTNQWAQGWIVFIDANNNNVIDSTAERIKINQALSQGSSIVTNNNRIVYTSMGFVSSGNFQARITAPGCFAGYGRLIDVSTTGRVSISQVNC